MKNKNIIFNHTLEEYNKKYRNRKYRLLKFTKKELEELDKKNNSNIKYHLLKDRKWWFIKDTYYEIPKPIRFTWFRNLNAACQVGTCLLLAGGVVATSIAVPLTLLNKNNTVEEKVTSEIIVDPVEESNVEILKTEKDSTYTYITLKCKLDTDEVTSVTVKKGEDTLKEREEYTFDKSNQKVSITNKAMNDHKGKVVITPKTEEKEVEGLVLGKTKFNLAVGSDFTLEVKQNPSGKTVEFKSSDEEVASVETYTNYATVTGKKVSSSPVTITATAGEYTATCIVNVLSAEKYLVAEGEHNIDIVRSSGYDLPTVKNQKGEIVVPDSFTVDNRKIVDIKNDKIVSKLTDISGKTSITISKEGYPDIDYPVFVGSFDKLKLSKRQDYIGYLEPSESGCEGDLILPGYFYLNNEILATYYIYAFTNKQITSLYVPYPIHWFHNNVFSHDSKDTSKLTKVTFEEIGPSSQILYLNKECFKNNALLSEITIPARTCLDDSTYEELFNEFEGCDALKTVTINSSSFVANNNPLNWTHILDNATTVKVLNTIKLPTDSPIIKNFPNVTHETNYDVYTK